MVSLEELQLRNWKKQQLILEVEPMLSEYQQLVSLFVALGECSGLLLARLIPEGMPAMQMALRQTT